MHLFSSFSPFFLLLFFSASAPASGAFNPVLSATDELQIRNKLSLYAIAIDSKNFDLVDQVFTRDAVVDYRIPNASVLHGLPAVKKYLAQALTGFVTQHTLSTTVVERVGAGGRGGVNSTVYLVANYLGQGNLTGSTAYVYGRYMDSWTEREGKGVWKSKARTLELFPPGFLGSTAVLTTPNA